MRMVAIIPARGGSKRLPGKNVRPLAGKPLIAWTIEAALQANCIDRVIVSTDCPEIAKVARAWGAEVPFLRPPKLAADNSGTAEAIQHALEASGCRDTMTHVALLQPTSPLRTAAHIDEAWALLQQRGAQAVVSVTPCEHPPQWANVLPDDFSLDGFLAKAANRRSQDLGESYRLNGALYLFETPLAWKMDALYGAGSFAYVMQNRDSVDIDQLLDFQFAEFLLGQNET